MASPEDLFVKELETFRIEVESGIQFLYSWLTVKTVASENEDIVATFNVAPIFWNTVLAALQTSFLITLGRIFDPDPAAHSIHRLLSLAHANVEIFSKEALGKRKIKSGGTNIDEWLEDYLRNVYVPAQNDFRKLKRYTATRRKIYESNYRLLRHKVFAHKETLDMRQLSDLYAKASIRDLQKLYISLRSIYEALWELLYNGKKPQLRLQRYSVIQMRKNPSPKFSSKDLQERLVKETEEFLQLLVPLSKKTN